MELGVDALLGFSAFLQHRLLRICGLSMTHILSNLTLTFYELLLLKAKKPIVHPIHPSPFIFPEVCSLIPVLMQFKTGIKLCLQRNSMHHHVCKHK